MNDNRNREANAGGESLSKPKGGLVSNEQINDTFSDFDLVFYEDDGEVYTDSLKVAKAFSKNHRDVLRTIREAVAKICASGENQDYARKMFVETFFEYTSGEGRSVTNKAPMFKMNQDGFALIAMGYTGQRAMDFKIRYIKAFNAMKSMLENIYRVQSSGKSSKIQEMEAEARLMEAEARVMEERRKASDMFMELGNRTSIPEYKSISESYAINTLAGKNVASLPEATEKTFSASEVGKIIGISGNMVGIVANEYNLKTKENGKMFYDKSRYSNKEVETFRYYESAIPKIKRAYERREEAKNGNRRIIL